VHDAVMEMLSDTFGGVAVRDNQFGMSTYPDPDVSGGLVRCRDYERLLIVDIPIAQVAEAYELYSQCCPLWAHQFKQRQLYLKITTPEGAWVRKFAPNPPLEN